MIAEDFTANLNENRKASVKSLFDCAQDLMDFGSTSQVKPKLLFSKKEIA